jgi:hypothetical protein
MKQSKERLLKLLDETASQQVLMQALEIDLNKVKKTVEMSPGHNISHNRQRPSLLNQLKNRF